jgi:drug/metabolite transporter (DMT)-like permease
LIHRDTFTGVMFALLAAVGFSAKAILIKLAYLEHVDAITLLALRMLFAVPFFIGVAIWLNFRDHHSLKLQDWIAVIVLGLMGYYLSSFLDFLGLLYITAGLERLILFLYPTMTVILSAIIYKHAIGKKIIMAMALSYAGIVLVFLHDVSLSHTNADLNQSEVWLGAGLVFASALSYSSYLVGAGHAIARMGATRFTAYASIVASFASLLQFVLTYPMSSLSLSYRVYEMSLAMAIFSTVLPVFMLSYAIRRIGSGNSSLIGSVGPVATIGLAYVFLHEPISAMQIAGTMLVLAGVLMISLNSKKIRTGV